MLKDLVSRQDTVWLRRPPEDNVNYTIPQTAVEKEIPLSVYDKANGYTRRLEFWLNGKKVGEKGFGGGGVLIYEEPLRDGRQHGLFKGFHDNGILSQERPMRRGRLHGVLRTWDERGVLEDVSFWIRGRPVRKEAYAQACKYDGTLPKFPAKADGEPQDSGRSSGKRF